jgi:KDO2-lipid IV(A) lauroyltransferase
MDVMDRWLNTAVRLLLTTLGRLPESMRTSGAVCLGTLTCKVVRPYRRIVIRNLTKAFGRSQTTEWIEAVTRNFFINLWRSLFELGWSLTVSTDQLANHITVSGLSEYRQAQAKGKGVLLLSAHFGNWELLAPAAHLAQIPFRIVYRPLDATFLEKFVRDTRTRFGAQVIPNYKGAMRKVFRNLRDGNAVIMLMDQSADWYDGVFIDFFNQGTFTNSGLALLALKTGAPVVPLFLIREKDGFNAVFGPELPLIQTGDHTKDVEANTQQYNNVIEAYARMYPDQWFWVHRRWKNPPYWPWPRVLKKKK